MTKDLVKSRIYLTLDNGHVVALWDVGDDEKVSVETIGALTVHKPAMISLQCKIWGIIFFILKFEYSFSLEAS